MAPSPLFLKIRAIAFSLIIFFSLLWTTLLSVYLYYEWDTSDPAERPIVAVMIFTDTLTLIMLLVLLILEFKAWLDAARLLFLMLAHIGSAAVFAFWNPSFQCPTSSPDAEGICRLLNLYILVASWLIPVLLILYAVGLAIAMVRASRHNEPPMLERDSILPMMRPTSDVAAHVLSYSCSSEKSINGSTPEDRRKHISEVPSRTHSTPHNSLTKFPPFLV
ncbi:hypothetical protein B0H15DRAFT_823841 [Mycena belliarum]|uniref:Uncharacterized protein n=1 Tax=Mycena belliarum TaxID=1033014 RepID=A0AAD6UCM1_9AGAR|nr:hypothetical protein B0H15DRAFT_823841 [Mycena belliae]